MKKIILLSLIFIGLFGQYYDPRKYINKKGLDTLKVYLHDATTDTVFLRAYTTSSSVRADSGIFNHVTGTVSVTSCDTAWRADSLLNHSAYRHGDAFVRSDTTDSFTIILGDEITLDDSMTIDIIEPQDSSYVVFRDIRADGAILDDTLLLDFIETNDSTHIRFACDVWFDSNKTMFFQRDAPATEYGEIKHTGNDFTINAGDWADTDITFDGQGIMHYQLDAGTLRVHSTAFTIDADKTDNLDYRVLAGRDIDFYSAHDGSGTGIAFLHNSVEKVAITEEGISGGNMYYTTVDTISFDTSSPCTLVTVADGYIVNDTWIDIISAWDGDGTVNIGDPNDADGFLPDGSMSKGTEAIYGFEMDARGAYLWDGTNNHIRQMAYNGAESLTATIVTGTSTQGQAVIYFGIKRLH